MGSHYLSPAMGERRRILINIGFGVEGVRGLRLERRWNRRDEAPTLFILCMQLVCESEVLVFLCALRFGRFLMPCLVHHVGHGALLHRTWPRGDLSALGM
jgi:hypothetical protein